VRDAKGGCGWRKMSVMAYSHRLYDGRVQGYGKVLFRQ